MRDAEASLTGKGKAAMADACTTTVSRLPCTLPRREIVFALDGFRCVWCGRPVWRGFPGIRRQRSYQATEDHLIPKARGGGSGLSNIVTACFRCNHLRTNKPMLPTMPEARLRRALLLDVQRNIYRRYLWKRAQEENAATGPSVAAAP